MRIAPYFIEEYVRWSDVDFAGIIFYGAYVRFFEIAETELFRACGLAYAQLFDRYDMFLPRKAVHSEFYSPARLDDRLRVATYVGRIGTTSLTLNFDVFRGTGPALTAAGWMVLVCVDRKQLQPRPLPAGVVEALAPHTLSLVCGRAVGDGVVLQGSAHGNGVLIYVRSSDSAPSGEFPLMARADSTTARGAIVTARFQAGDMARGVVLDSGTVAVSRAGDVLSATARGAGAEVAGTGRLALTASFKSVRMGPDTVQCTARL